MIRVIHLIRSLHKAGAEKLCIDICTELNSRNDIEVLLVSMSPVNHFKEQTQELTVKTIDAKVFPSISGKNIVETKAFEDIVREFKPDIVHSHLFWSDLLAQETYFPNVKYITHCHDNIYELSNFNWRLCFKKKLGLPHLKNIG